jgi:hypothetical protein
MPEENSPDSKLFSHHLEMARHHIDQLAEMHGLDAGEDGQPEGDNMDDDTNDKAFAGNESPEEENMEEHEMAKKVRARRR